jgi:large subunit ribosomal protein L31
VAGRQHLSLVDVDISQAGHPFWTGRTRAADTEGRIARFRRRYGQGALPGAEPSPASD